MVHPGGDESGILCETGYLPVQREANSVEVLDRAIAEAELEISDVLRESLVVGMTVVDQCQLYTMKPTTFGNEVRALLADTIAAQAEEDRAEVEALLQSGRDLSQAVEELDPDARFEEWYNKTYETLKGISA